MSRPTLRFARADVRFSQSPVIKPYRLLLNWLNSRCAFANFDLIVLSKLSGHEEHRILNVVDGAEVLLLDGLTMPAELLSLVAERLQSSEKRDS
jgi:hypothetical protein